MSKTDLTFHGLTSGLADGNGPRLMVQTPSGLIRQIPLTRADLMKILGSAVGALNVLDKEEAKGR